jgi:type I restriction enzyme S subunit
VPESAVRDFPIPTPPLPEQEKIAAILWKIQRAIETEEKLIATARELKQSAMRQLFTHGLHGEPQKDTEIGLIPKSWRVARLAEFAHFQRGFDITKKAQQQGNVPVVSSGGIKSWHNEAAAKGPGVIIGRKGSIGSVHYIDQDYWPHDTTLWCTDFRANVPLFVYYRLLVLDLKRLDSGAANPALNRNFLHEELISWPDPDEQQEIANILQTIDRKISLHERKRATLQDLFQTLLHKLMTAEIRVANLDIDTREVKT